MSAVPGDGQVLASGKSVGEIYLGELWVHVVPMERVSLGLVTRIWKRVWCYTWIGCRCDTWKRVWA